jgi:hypothetical protein
MKEVHEVIIKDLQDKFGDEWSPIYRLAVGHSLAIHDFATVFDLDSQKVLAIASTIAKLVGANHAQKAQDEIEKFLGEIDKANLDDKDI